MGCKLAREMVGPKRARTNILKGERARKNFLNEGKDWMVHGFVTNIEVPSRVHSKVIHIVLQKGSYAKHTCTCASPAEEGTHPTIWYGNPRIHCCENLISHKRHFVCLQQCQFTERKKIKRQQVCFLQMKLYNVNRWYQQLCEFTVTNTHSWS
jgi:hypothetical protein